MLNVGRGLDQTVTDARRAGNRGDSRDPGLDTTSHTGQDGDGHNCGQHQRPTPPLSTHGPTVAAA